MAADILSAERLREVVDYDPATGVFTRKVRLAQRHQVGDRADFVITAGNQRGYYRVCVDSRRYMAHRCAWLCVHGAWPEHDIDHINGDRGDNRIANLRDVPNQINRQNMRGPRSDNKSGLLGVHWHEGTQKWRARVQLEGRVIEAGLHETREQAHAAYLQVKRKAHEGCTI